MKRTKTKKKPGIKKKKPRLYKHGIKPQVPVPKLKDSGKQQARLQEVEVRPPSK